MPSTARPLRARSTALAPVDIARLRLCLPFTLSDRALREVSRLSLGGGYEWRRVADGSAFELVLFALERVLNEVLNFSPGKELVRAGWVPVAGCGRRGRAIYFVQLLPAGFGELRRYNPGENSPCSVADDLAAAVAGLEPLGVQLSELFEKGAPRADLRLRRRLPHGPSAPSLVRAKPQAKPSLGRAARSEQSLRVRNLSLF